jgi:hypothetical protein
LVDVAPPHRLRGLIKMPTTNTDVFGGSSKPLIDATAVAGLLRPFTSSIQLAVIEHVHAMPNQGVVSMFRFGEGYGMLLGVLAALGLRTIKIKPAVWKSALNLSSDKAASLKLASELWHPFCKEFSIKKNDGLAEAALLAYYGTRIYQRENGGGVYDIFN